MRIIKILKMIILNKFVHSLYQQNELNNQIFCNYDSGLCYEDSLKVHHLLIQ